MKVFKYCLIVLAIFFSTFIYAQSNDPVLIRIGDDIQVTKSEFDYAFRKDKNYNTAKQEDIQTFLDSYVNFKLAIEEAKKQGLDKSHSFQNEYSAQIEQFQEPYLTDSITPLDLAKKIYERMKENLQVHQILIRLPEENLLPKDTIGALNEIISIRESIINGDGVSFEDMAKAYSEDSISRNSSMPGLMGWKTAFSTPYPFEEVMFNLPLNTISEPFRTYAGYHIIKVTDKRPDPGQINIAHILLYFPQYNPTFSQRDSIRTLANNIYNKLISGESFNVLNQEYSQDRMTENVAGNLGWFGVNRAVPAQFETILWNMKNVGDISLPVEEDYGYHIFKLIGKVPLMPWERMKDNLIKAIQESDRNEVLTQQRIKKISDKYNYELNSEIYHKMKNAANDYTLSDSLFYEEISANNQGALLRINNGDTYTIKDFIYYIERNPQTHLTLSTDILHSKINEFILEKLIEAQRKDIPKEHLDFRYLAQDFYDGMLFFEIMNKEVWPKAENNRQALEKLFESDQQKYTWDNSKFKGWVIHARDKKTLGEVKKILTAHKNEENLRAIINDTFNTDSVKKVMVEKGLWAKGENPYVDRKIFNQHSNHEIVGYPEFTVEGKLISKPESLDDALGLVTADYLELVEKQWYESLRRKYSVNIDSQVLESIKKEYE